MSEPREDSEQRETSVPQGELAAPPGPPALGGVSLGCEPATPAGRPGQSPAGICLQPRVEPGVEGSAPSTSPPRLGDASVLSGQLHGIDGPLQAEQDHCGARVVRGSPGPAGGWGVDGTYSSASRCPPAPCSALRQKTASPQACITPLHRRVEGAHGGGSVCELEAELKQQPHSQAPRPGQRRPAATGVQRPMWAWGGHLPRSAPRASGGQIPGWHRKSMDEGGVW